MERELRCKRCNKYVPIKEMKYEKTGTFLVCAACRGEEKKAPKVMPLVKRPFGEPKLYKYQCRDCRYQFKRSPVSPVSKCPNCGSSKLIRYEKMDADDVLKLADIDKI